MGLVPALADRRAAPGISPRRLASRPTVQSNEAFGGSSWPIAWLHVGIAENLGKASLVYQA